MNVAWSLVATRCAKVLFAECNDVQYDWYANHLKAGIPQVRALL